jgi:hypothetical protein
MKLLIENWRKYLTEIIITRDRYGRNKLYATRDSLLVFLDTIKSYKDRGFRDEVIISKVDRHVVNQDFKNYTDLSWGFKFTVHDYNKLVKTYLNHIDIDPKEVIELFISGNLDSLEPTKEKYVATDSEVGYFPWIKQLESDPEEFIYSQASKEENSREGSYRMVVVPDSDPDYVIKHAKYKKSFPMNKVEKILGDQYPEVFPKVYASAPDFEWIVVERCVPITLSNTELVEEALVATMPDFYEFARQAYSEAMKEPDPDAYDVLMYILGIKFYKHSSEDSIERKVYDFGLANEPWYRQFAKAVQRYGIDTGDIRYHNIGIDMKTHTLKLIDASVFNPDDGEKRWK